MSKPNVVRLGVYGVFLTATAACGPPPPVTTCGRELPASSAVLEGGRVTLPRGDDLRGELLGKVLVDDDVRATLTSESIILRAPVGVGSRDITVVCSNGEQRTVTIDVKALSFTRVLEWSADENAGIPAGREYFAWWMSPNAEEHALYLYGGFAYAPRQFTPRYDLYRFDLTSLSWAGVSQTGTLPDPGGRVATSADGVVHYFGGATLADNGSLITNPGFLRWQASSSSASAFDPVPGSESAPGSYTGSLLYDGKRDRWLSICGADSIALGVHCAVHQYREATGWTSLDVAGPAPPGRFGFHYAYDDEDDRFVVYGGQGAGANDVFADAWVLDLSSDAPAWVPLPAANGFARRNGAYAYDPFGKRLMLWGGTGDGNTALPGIDILTLDPGQERWLHVDVDVAGPDARASGQCVFDDLDARVLCGMGNASRVYTDLWALPLLPSP